MTPRSQIRNSKVKIKEEPESEEGYEPEREIEDESEEESVESSPRVIIRKTATGNRNRRRAQREKILRDQATKPAHERLGTKHVKLRLGGGVARSTRKRTRTPSTEIMSDENEVTPVNPGTVSPKSTAMMARYERNYLRNFNKRKNKVKVYKEAEDSEEPSDSEYEEEDQRDSKMSKSKKNQRQ